MAERPLAGLRVLELARVLAAIDALLPPLAERTLVPTDAQLARTYPSGKAVASRPR